MAYCLHLRLFLALVCYCVHLANAAFTLPTTYSNNVIEETSNKTWCYYPAAGETRDVSCTSDFTEVSLVYLNTTISIGYYAPDNTCLGGADWSVPQVNPGRVTLCVSGQVEDGTYQTTCVFITVDNSLPLGSGGCWIAIAQNKVTDGCYVPGELPFSVTMMSTSLLGATGTYGSSYTPPPITSASRSQPISKIFTFLFFGAAKPFWYLATHPHDFILDYRRLKYCCKACDLYGYCGGHDDAGHALVRM